MKRAPSAAAFVALAVLGVLSPLLSACASAPASERPGGRATTTDAAPSDFARAGEEILGRACTACHDLDGLAVFADYWGEPEWRSMIDTMISYGAVLTAEEYETLARYLTDTYAPTVGASRPPPFESPVASVRRVNGRRPPERFGSADGTNRTGPPGGRGGWAE